MNRAAKPPQRSIPHWLGRIRQYAEATTELKEAIRLKPDLADAHFALGLAFLSPHDKRQALSEADALSRINSQLARQLKDLVDRRPFC
jgi:tetratricopeptide (TPR) repeat protein